MNININIEFFKSDVLKAIKPGVYKISVLTNGRSRCLYIGESFSMLIRCATHLYELNIKPEYFGFTSNNIQDNNITIKFEVDKVIDDKTERKAYEKKLIKELLPISQSKISDRMKAIDKKIEALNEFLNDEV